MSFTLVTATKDPDRTDFRSAGACGRWFQCYWETDTRPAPFLRCLTNDPDNKRDVYPGKLPECQRCLMQITDDIVAKMPDVIGEFNDLTRRQAEHKRQTG